ncbi:heme o synthase [Acidihalobacter ferrooxydans]|uniref:Protoheme IX farnesyltransferase n=1 Tax=Acidihalobacter ferrooxydans TaxID=1765967 RepID=A0A1P8UDV3_9GAMM|nr:heme o synthase [Acidihalobacter ferrooxydans]APZ41944.1 protoheme IX farnesyltransferase [Acidihalobacter ferrooxydans]
MQRQYNAVPLEEAAVEAASPAGGGLIKDLLALSKAKVVSLLVFTGIVGELLAPSVTRHWAGALAGLAGIALAGGAGGVINQLIEPGLDQTMRRTRRRPLANGRISRGGGMLFAGVLLAAAVIVLAVWTNPLTLALTLGGTVGYGIVYTLYLKPNTPWNIVWGGIAGALPPLIGWTAVGDPIAAMPLVLVGLVFLWTPAHFWPLALCCREDYANACIPMLPVTHGVERTRREVVNYAVATLAISLAPAALGAGPLYGVVAAVAGTWYLLLTLRLKRMPESKAMDLYARHVFKASINYLFILFAALVVGHMTVLTGWVTW